MKAMFSFPLKKRINSSVSDVLSMKEVRYKK